MISVVIPAHNEAERIVACLEALANQKTTREYEVILVDNASTDRTVELAIPFTTRFNLKIISEPRRGRGAARATGFAAATGDIICSTDSDSTVPADWIERFASFLESNAAIAVAGTCQIFDNSPKMNKRFNNFQPRAMLWYRRVFRHYWLTGSNCAIKREHYQASGGFDPYTRDLEDIDLGFRLAKLGTIAYMPNNPVTTSGHRFQNSLWGGSWPYIKTFIKLFFFRQRAAARD